MQPGQGSVAVISGGLGDIGQAIVRAFCRAGCRVAVCDLAPPESAAPLLAELGSAGSFHYAQVDVSDAAAVDVWLNDLESQFGCPSYVVPNAAIVTRVPALEMTAQQWQRELAVNLNGAYFLAASAARKMTACGTPGRIVFVGSWAAHAPHPQIIAYSTAKAGLRMMAQCLALQLAPAGILVNEVAPGYVDAGLSAQLFREDPGLRDAAAARTPLRRLIEPDEVADAVIWLCSDSSRNCTGSVLLMDGGLSLMTPAGAAR
ncbi:MAG: SDR family oxidoreductase [Armatimonadetes bacterium]|nr:SDR family oxidoreductase [Armatimonadota bacterium]MDE2207418.1 SDR family oxidoreductase [Armatimonadota bacterium]